MKSGVFYGMLAYVIWGFLPIYLKIVGAIATPIEIALHRMIWSLFLMTAILIYYRDFKWINHIKNDPKILFFFAITAFLIASNWLLYIWSVNHNLVVDASLGYFILPIFNVVLGYVFLKERMRKIQVISVVIALIGVLWMIFIFGKIPWIALFLAATFAIYGILRKISKLDAIEGLFLETFILAPFAIIWLLFLAKNQQSAFFNGDIKSVVLLIFAGPITAIPLLFFAKAARLIPLYLLGFVQYIGPILQFLLGVFLWNEEVNLEKLIGFILIWIALIIYSLEGLCNTKSNL